MQHLTKQWALTGPDRPRPGASFGLGACSEPITSSESGSSELVVCSSCRAQTENLHLVLKKIHGAVLTPRLLHLQEVLLDVFADARPELRLAEAVSVWESRDFGRRAFESGHWPWPRRSKAWARTSTCQRVEASARRAASPLSTSLFDAVHQPPSAEPGA